MRVVLGLALVVPLAATGQAVTLPQGAELDPPTIVPGSQHDLLASPWQAGGPEVNSYSGERTDRIARIVPPRPVDELTDELVASLAGFDVVFDCQAARCGGFDFRFALDLAPEPAMHVDIDDYRYVLAEKGPEAVALVVSRSDVASFVQVTEIGAPSVQKPVTETDPPDVSLTLPDLPSTLVPDPVEPTGGAVIAALTADGHAVLEDLTFATGSSDLGEGDFPSLAELGAWLADNPTVLIGIVGHTDAVGGLDANIALSKRRAESVAARLVSTYGIDRARIEALGAGYLSPRATNQTEEGREANRRVEVILTAVQ